MPNVTNSAIMDKLLEIQTQVLDNKATIESVKTLVGPHVSANAVADNASSIDLSIQLEPLVRNMAVIHTELQDVKRATMTEGSSTTPVSKKRKAPTGEAFKEYFNSAKVILREIIASDDFKNVAWNTALDDRKFWSQNETDIITAAYKNPACTPQVKCILPRAYKEVRKKKRSIYIAERKDNADMKSIEARMASRHSDLRKLLLKSCSAATIKSFAASRRPSIVLSDIHAEEVRQQLPLVLPRYMSVQGAEIVQFPEFLSVHGKELLRDLMLSEQKKREGKIIPKPLKATQGDNISIDDWPRPKNLTSPFLIAALPVPPEAAAQAGAEIAG